MPTDTKPLDTRSRVTSVLTVIGCHACPERRRLEETLTRQREAGTRSRDAETPATEPAPAVGAMTDAHLGAAAREAEGCHACQKDPESRVDALLTAITVNNLVEELDAWKDAAAAGASEFSRVEKTLTRQRDAARAEALRMTDLRDSAIAELAAYKKQAEEERAITAITLNNFVDELNAYKAQAQEDVERIADLSDALNERDNLILELRDRLPVEPGEPTSGPLTTAQRMQATRLFHRLTLDASEAAHLREENAKILARLDKSEVKL